MSERTKLFLGTVYLLALVLIVVGNVACWIAAYLYGGWRLLLLAVGLTAGVVGWKILT